MKAFTCLQLRRLITGALAWVLLSAQLLQAYESVDRTNVPEVFSDTGIVLGNPLSNVELEPLRGGFFTADGLEFAFSFESITRVNGDVLSQANVVVPVLSLIDNPTSALGVNQAISPISQTALSGDAAMQASQSGLIFEPVVLQNVLNGQVIETINVLNLQVFGTSTLNAREARAAILPTLVSALKQ